MKRLGDPGRRTFQEASQVLAKEISKKKQVKDSCFFEMLPFRHGSMTQRDGTAREEGGGFRMDMIMCLFTRGIADHGPTSVPLNREGQVGDVMGVCPFSIQPTPLI